MIMKQVLVAAALILHGPVFLACGQEPSPAAAKASAEGIDLMPILRLEAGAPTSFISSLAFSEPSSTLYSGSWDKVVRTWSLRDAAEPSTLVPAATYRVPIGPGLEGAINAVAVSPDGKWLAVAGRSMVRGASDLRHDGWVIPTAMPSARMQEDRGAIYLFDTRTAGVRVLKGHKGAVVTLTFTDGGGEQTPVLFSLGEENIPEGNQPVAAVRAWDVASAWQPKPQAYLGGVTLPPIVTKPDLTAWRLGQGIKQVQVAIGAGDGTLRIWNLDSNKLAKHNTSNFKDVVAWWADGGRLLTGSGSRLNLWNVESVNTAAIAGSISLREGDVPLDIVLFASARGGRIDRAAIAVRNGGVAWLRVADLNSLQLLANAEVQLWGSGGNRPILAAAPGARLLAIAGQANHEITTLSIDDLLSGRGVVGKLGGTGLVAGHASFVKQRDSLGLAISAASLSASVRQQKAPKVERLVFDAARRSISKDEGDWQVAQPNLAGWRVEQGSQGEGRDKRFFFQVFEPNRGLRTFLLPPRRLEVTSYAPLPPVAPLNVPLLAVASRLVGGEPELEIYDLSAGQSFGTRVRRLSGHVDQINSVAFSDDGKLLATTARDQTVCVWNMDDLGQVVRTRGTVSDMEFSFNSQKRALTVSGIQATGRNIGALAKGDVVLGWADGSKTVPIESLGAFYLRLSKIKPGEKSPPLRVQRGVRPIQNVQIAVTQGADERKPLFTLFVQNTEPWDWIAWSPLGPFESSGKAIEQLVGWHFNLVDDEEKISSALTRFSAIGEYENLQRQGLIDHMLRTRKLPAVKPRPLDRPEMSIRLKPTESEIAAPDEHDGIIRFARGAELEVDLGGLASDRVSGMTLQVNGGVSIPLAAVSRSVWRASLAGLPKQRHPELHGSVIVKTNEVDPQTFSKPLAFLYQGQSPQIEVNQPSDALTVTEQATLKLEANIRLLEGPKAGLKMEVTHSSAAGTKQLAPSEPVMEGDVARIEVPDTQLQPGENTFTIVAVNPEAPSERSVVVRRVVLKPPKMVSPPQFIVQVLSPESGLARELTNELDEPLIVESPELRLEGRILSDEPLAEAKWGANDTSASFTNFKPNAEAPFNVSEDITLQPGEQQIRCVAKGAGGMASTVGLTVVYIPPASQPLIVEPQTDLKLYDGRDPRIIRVSIRLEPPADNQEVSVLLNGKELSEKAIFDSASATYRAEVNLEETPLGENHLAARTATPLGAVRTSNEVAVSFLRAPQILDLKCPAQVDSPLLTCSFDVLSPAGMELTELEVNGWLLPLDSAKLDTATGRWKVEATGIPLREVVNTVTPRARNAHGWSVLTKTSDVTVMLPPPPKATVAFESPSTNINTSFPQLDEIRFSVRSPSPLERVVLLHNGSPILSESVKQPAPGTNEFGFKGSMKAIKLIPGQNDFDVVAVNAGGEIRETRTVNHVIEPVSVLVDRAVSKGMELDVYRKEGGVIQFSGPVADGGDVVLYGRVRWPDAKAKREINVTDLHLWVNGFLQPAAQLAASSSNALESTWQVKVRLSKAAANSIEMGLPGVPRETSQSLIFNIDCLKPDTHQRLHLLVVGVGEDDPEQLEKLALSAVGASTVAKKEGKRAIERSISAPAFDRAWIYRLSDQNVSHSNVVYQLQNIRRKILGQKNSGSDVVIVYYRGEEDLNNGQYALTTSDHPIVSRDLARFSSTLPGAQLFFLDVKRPVLDARPTVWPREPHTAAMRYVWPVRQGLPENASLLDTFNDLVTANAAERRPTRLHDVQTQAARAPQLHPALKFEPNVPLQLEGLVLVNAPGSPAMP